MSLTSNYCGLTGITVCVCVSFFLHLVKSSSAWKVKWFFLINLNWTAKKTVENVLHVVEKRNFTETISECPALDYFLMNWTTTGKCGTNGNWQIFNRIQNKKKLPVDIVWNTVWNWKPFFVITYILWTLLIPIDHYLHRFHQLVHKFTEAPQSNCIPFDMCSIVVHYINFTVDLFFNCFQSW